jgi:hypothetical protein
VLPVGSISGSLVLESAEQARVHLHGRQLTPAELAAYDAEPDPEIDLRPWQDPLLPDPLQ